MDINLDKQLAVGDVVVFDITYSGMPLDPYRVVHELSVREMIDAYRVAWKLDANLRQGADVDSLCEADRMVEWLLNAKIIEPLPHEKVTISTQEAAAALGLEL